jgi:osmotically-inducible protein OsmY
MKRTDAELQRDVSAELRWDPKVRDEEVAVAVKDGVVTLAGTVETYAQKMAAERAAERVSGIRALAERLEVKPPSDRARTDTELAHLVADALRWHAEVPREKVKARVEKGWVTLDGEVEWKFERDAAERAVRYLHGVRGVVNLVAIRPHVSAYDVSQRIKEALRRRAELDASHIDVLAADGMVTLKGTVRSWTERADAESAAWAATGVRDVDDRLTVKP